MIRTPYELPLPGTPHFSMKERFFEMRCFADQIWREENGFKDGALIEIKKRKPKAVKTRVVRDSNLYRSL